jgi:hypothetical protein
MGDQRMHGSLNGAVPQDECRGKQRQLQVIIAVPMLLVGLDFNARPIL